MSKYNRRLMRLSVQEQLDNIEKQYHESFCNPHGMTKTCYVIKTPSGRDAVVDLINAAAYQQSLDNLPDECYDGLLSKEAVFKAVCEERDYQDKKWGANRPQSLAGFLLILDDEIEEAKKGWMKNQTGRNAPLNEIVQIAAVCFAALERYGVDGITINTNDIPQPQTNR